MKDLDVLWRRVIAYYIDCLFILIFAVCLGGGVLALQKALGITLTQHAGLGHIIAFTTLTLPALLYFALTEISEKQASFAKRFLGLRVQTISGEKASFKKACLRAVILLLPWEIAHTAIWYGSPQPFITPPAIWALCLMIGAQLMLVIYFFMAIASPRRSVAERLTGLEVLRVRE